MEQPESSPPIIQRVAAPRVFFRSSLPQSEALFFGCFAHALVRRSPDIHPQPRLACEQGAIEIEVSQSRPKIGIFPHCRSALFLWAARNSRCLSFSGIIAAREGDAQTALCGAALPFLGVRSGNPKKPGMSGSMSFFPVRWGKAVRPCG